VESPEECRRLAEANGVTWVNIEGLHDTRLIQRFGDVFGIHPLVLEDIANTNQCPRAEDLGDTIYLVFKMLYGREGEDELVTEQVSLLLFPKLVLTFQEVEGDVFDIIRERIRSGKGRIRNSGADYLAYSLVDAVVDHYFVVLDRLGERMETLQDRVVEDPSPPTVAAIHTLHSDLIYLRKTLWPMRELVGAMERSDSPLIDRAHRPYWRDIYEHTIQVIDHMESLRDLLSSALDIYMSAVSNRLNDIMRVLTIIATVFIPLTFIAGVYGMNFRHMPELGWRYGYAAVWLVMLAAAGGMLAYFRRQRWF
jgi:magnesium transporter